MPATARRSKSNLYEKGIREGMEMANRARGNKSPKKEEEEMDMGMDPKHSRKRSAKGAKNTKPAKDGMGMKKPMDGGMYGKKPMDGDKGMKKEMEMDMYGKKPMDGAMKKEMDNMCGGKNKRSMDGGMYGKKPMDAECGCKGKKGRKCDGNCGSMRKRSDSLTPQEYLTACEMGIQDRSATYIRARLDTAEARNDLKCGKGAISEGEKCTKGQAIKVEPKKAAAKKEFRAIMNTNKGAQRFVAAKGSTKGVGNKLKLAGEIAAKLGGGASAGLGLAQIYTGAQTGNLGQISRGFRNAQLGGAAVQLANASKASRLGKAGLAKEFAKSAGRQAAVGVGQEAALGAYAGFKRTQGALGLRNSVRSAYQKAQRRRGGVRAYSTSISRRKRDGVYAQGFPADSAKYYV